VVFLLADMVIFAVDDYIKAKENYTGLMIGLSET